MVLPGLALVDPPVGLWLTAVRVEDGRLQFKHVLASLGLDVDKEGGDDSGSSCMPLANLMRKGVRKKLLPPLERQNDHLRIPLVVEDGSQQSFDWVQFVGWNLHLKLLPC